MKTILFFCTLLVAVILLTSCSTERAVDPGGTDSAAGTLVDRDQTAAQIVALAGWSTEADADLPEVDPEKFFGPVVAFDRELVAEGIAHYRWEVQVGADARDRIALHRVVREQRRGPIRTRKAIFLQHGDGKDFRGMFLPGTLQADTPDDFGAAIWWARHDVDVWGIDQAWTMVPAETTDFGFMADWGMTKQADDLGLGVALARLVRLATGNGYARMHVLGYSSGAATGYALVDAETQLPPGLRQVGGWIPVDYSPVGEGAEWEAFQCGPIADLEAQIAAGEYGYFVGFDFMGVLARDEPDADSPVFPGFSNLQAAMFLGAGPIFELGDSHYLGGVWEDGLPVDFVHTTIPEWLDFMVSGAPWQPTQQILDYSLWGCSSYDVPWDDHFAAVEVPVLNVGAGGGIGPWTDYCLDLLGSDDITNMNVQLLADDEALFDFGHIDLWIADEAPELVWQPILDWVVTHSPGPGHRPGRAHTR